MSNLFYSQDSSSLKQNMGFTNPSTQTLEQLQKRVPGIGDKAIIDLINGIQINKDIVRYRKNRGWFGNLISKLDGSDHKRQLLLDGNLIAGQEALSNWVLELTDSLKISQIALEITQNSLLEARDAIRNQKQDYKPKKTQSFNSVNNSIN